MNKRKIFDPADGFLPLTDVAEITDATVVKRGDQWWMYVAGQRKNDKGIHLFSASLAPGLPLSATGWRLTADRNDPTRVALLAGYEASSAWDLKGGRHCPSYVTGWDTVRQAWLERIYYAGAAENPWGPYAIGFLEWDGFQWVDQPEPVFAANEDWEHGSVYEPNLIYDEGKWKLWYVAGSNHEGYLVHGFAESTDGRTGWSPHKIFAPREMNLFDFCVIKNGSGFEAVFSRVELQNASAPSAAGLWWCRAETPGSELSDWSEPVQIMTAESRGWHAGPWKPSIRYGDSDPTRMFVFCDGMYATPGAEGFPFAFTLGCLELERPNVTEPK